MNLRAAWNALWNKSSPSYAAGGYGGGPAFVDAYRSRRSPTLPELVEAYKAITYACAMLNANGVARVPLRLYATTHRGQARPKCGTKALHRHHEALLRKSPAFSSLLRKAVEIDEVVDHPLLEALQDVNPDFDHNALIRHAVLSLDIVGSAYWFPEVNRLGVAVALWPLQAQYVTPVQVAGESAVCEYRYFQDRYRPEQLIRARHVSVRDPHGFGYGPTQAAFEYVGLGDKYVSVQENLLGQGVRPSVIVSPKDATMPMGKDERRRFESDINARWRGPSAGRAWVVDGAIDVRPLTFPPSDLAALQISEHALQRVANCFGVPLSLLKTEDVNLANAEAGHRQHAELAIEPRCVLIASALTKWVRAQGRLNGLGWDRLFFAFDNPVAEDEERRAKVFDTYLRNSVLTINDVRPELGYDLVDWGNEPWQASSLTQPSIAEEEREQARAQVEDDEECEDEYEEDDDESGAADDEDIDEDSPNPEPDPEEVPDVDESKSFVRYVIKSLNGLQRHAGLRPPRFLRRGRAIEYGSDTEADDDAELDPVAPDEESEWIIRGRSSGAQRRGSRQSRRRASGAGGGSGRGFNGGWNPYRNPDGTFANGPGGKKPSSGRKRRRKKRKRGKPGSTSGEGTSKRRRNRSAQGKPNKKPSQGSRSKRTTVTSPSGLKVTLDASGNPVGWEWKVSSNGKRGSGYKKVKVPKNFHRGHIMSVAEGAGRNSIDDSKLNILPQTPTVNLSNVKRFEKWRVANAQGHKVVVTLEPNGYMRWRIPSKGIDVKMNPRSNKRWPDDWFKQGGTFH